MNTNSSNRKTDRSAKPTRAGSEVSDSKQKIAQPIAQHVDSKKLGTEELPTQSFLWTELSKQFMFWIPDPLPKGASVNISSSRLGQKLDQRETWFDALRTIAVQIQKEHKFLVSAESTTTDPMVARIAQLFGIPIVQFKPIPPKANKNWFSDTAAKANRDSSTQTVWYQQRESRSSRLQSKKKLNINDLLISIAHVVVLLSVKKSGNIYIAANRRLESQTNIAHSSIGSQNKENISATPSSNQTDRPSSTRASTQASTQASTRGSTRLLIDRSLTPKSVEHALLGKGARGWWLYDSDSPQQDKATKTPAAKSDSTDSQSIQPVILELEEIDSNQFALHWTRRRVGPWPDQTQSSYLDDLIFRNSRREHSELSALCRILASRRIIGSNNLTRDQRSVVCFSDIRIQQLKERRVFRPHLSRWDFEPYGLAIDRDLLRDLGARPVVYGDDSTWDTLSQFERPFFQSEMSSSEKIDWTREQEWRIVGDLRLDQIPRDRAFVFVRTYAQARIVAGLCHWPIVILGKQAG